MIKTYNSCQNTFQRTEISDIVTFMCIITSLSSPHRKRLLQANAQRFVGDASSSPTPLQPCVSSSCLQAHWELLGKRRVAKDLSADCIVSWLQLLWHLHCCTASSHECMHVSRREEIPHRGGVISLTSVSQMTHNNTTGLEVSTHTHTHSIL